MSAKLPLLWFAESAPASGVDVVQVDFDGLLEFGVFVEGVSRSGKTNLVRVLLEQTYGRVLHLVFDPEGEYANLRSESRPYLILGRARDVEIPLEVAGVKRLVTTLVERGVNAIFDLYNYDDDEQQTIVGAACDALVAMPENQPRDVLVVLEELQDFAPESGSRDSALSRVRRLAKRGLKRGVTIVGSTQRVADTSKGVVTQLKNKMIGGTDTSDAPRALQELGLPRRDLAAVTELHQGQFRVKGPAVSRHAQLVKVPRAETATPKRRRGEAPTPTPEAPAEIAALVKQLADVAMAAQPNEPPPPKPSAVLTSIERGARRGLFGPEGTHTRRIEAAQKPARTIVAPTTTNEAHVKESEARALRDTNDRLKSENADLRRRLDALERAPSANGIARREPAPESQGTRTPAEPTAISVDDYDALLRRLKTDLLKEPAVLRVLAQKPEIRVEVERPTIEAKPDSVQGRLALLLAKGFFDGGATGGDVQKEWTRRAFNVSPGTLYPALESLTQLGFLEIEDPGGKKAKLYKAVDGMKINIVER
jgi:hypothetical protein